jgi:hypothetical protein
MMRSLLSCARVNEIHDLLELLLQGSSICTRYVVLLEPLIQQLSQDFDPCGGVL